LEEILRNNKKKNKDFETLGSLINKMSKKLGIDRGLREITFVNLWPDLIGSRFEKDTKAVSIIKKQGYDVLLLAVSSSSVSQELFLYKNDILKKISSIALSLEFNIKDIIFNAKIWDQYNIKRKFSLKEENTRYFLKKELSDLELKNITVPENIVNFIKESILTQNFSSDELKDRMLGMIIKDIKTQIWKKNNGFPCCSKCGVPLDYYDDNNPNLCPACKF
jgi:hypothetical protein